MFEHKKKCIFSVKSQEKASRNRAIQRRDRARWRTDMRDMHEDGGGLFEMEIARPIGLRPSDTAMQLIRGWERAAAKSERGTSCAFCGATIHSSKGCVPGGWLVIMPAHPDHGMALVASFCSGCGAHTDEKLGEIFAQGWDGKVLSSAHMPVTSGRA